MLFHYIKETRLYVKEQKKLGKSIGLVPTMGYLHQGHLSLIKKAKAENDVVVVSVFINPIQFGPNDDFEKYPRDLQRDYNLALDAGADLLFNPSLEEMYPEKSRSFVLVQELTDNLCGASRPGHFQGVTTVVSKLFNIIPADRAYFGMKDAQQVAVITQMVKDLNFDIEIVPCPIIREKDGLALSSRNVYLNNKERQSALLLSQSLGKAEELIKQGERTAEIIVDSITSFLEKDPNCNIDYVEIVDFHTLKDLKILKNKVLIALAVKIGKTRLLDNIVMEVE
ncbi:MAG: pantoate--beta-alanine ligase [Peptococcaceae bacterium BICA1-8]|nr:MAG: pantoate--beta-alanine ligase [Peptococcaceae bacterium BICA1-8]